MNQMLKRSKESYYCNCGHELSTAEINHDKCWKCGIALSLIEIEVRQNE